MTSELIDNNVYLIEESYPKILGSNISSDIREYFSIFYIFYHI